MLPRNCQSCPLVAKKYTVEVVWPPTGKRRRWIVRYRLPDNMIWLAVFHHICRSCQVEAGWSPVIPERPRPTPIFVDQTII